MLKAFRFDPLNIVVCGIGGQGNVLASEVLGSAMTDRGYHVAVGETYGASQLGGDMVAQLGGVLVEPEASSIGKEDLLGLDPDVIFVVYMARTEGVEEEMRSNVVDDPAFAELSAVKNDRVCTIMLGDMYASTVRSIDGIRTFAAGMYPELYQ